MNPLTLRIARSVLLLVVVDVVPCSAAVPEFGEPGRRGTYRHEQPDGLRGNGVLQFSLTLGAMDSGALGLGQWLEIRATKSNGGTFAIWLLRSANLFPNNDGSRPTVLRYLVQEADQVPQEFVHRLTGAAVLPSLASHGQLWPDAGPGGFREGVLAPGVTWLGHAYRLLTNDQAGIVSVPSEIRRLELRPDVLVGVPSNSRTRDDTRRYDGSDYERVPLTRDNFAEMIRAGMNCFRVDSVQAGWLRDQPVFYWGIGGGDVPFPECLFRSTYLGPALFFDEPAVGTRDHDLRPRLAKDPGFGLTITPQVALETFQDHFRQAVQNGPATVFLKGMRVRADVDLGTLQFRQGNLFTWETMVASAAWQLTAEPDGGPNCMVFEPPGRLGSRRTLPEMNMAYGCQLSPDIPANLTGIIFGFLRGAARAAHKEWGVSIYGAVDRADAPWMLTHAYDLGATRFFFWDNYQLACVPYGECLALARHLQAHIQSQPQRNLDRLRRAAEVAILLPPGYDLGHTHMGRGNLWGLGELNLERTNRFGVPYRRVMAGFFTEIERCLRQGVAFDLLWDLPGLSLKDYREVVRVREDGRVEVTTGRRRTLHRGPRLPERPGGTAPGLVLEVEPQSETAAGGFTVRARVTERDAPVFYTTGADRRGIHQNVRVLWELYGPGEENYRTLPTVRVELPPGMDGPATVETRFTLQQKGRYRLRAATSDLAGRSTVVWKTLRAGHD